jgi:ornithine carbamoyltransferase
MTVAKRPARKTSALGAALARRRRRPGAKRDLLDLCSLSADELWGLLNLAARLKGELRAGLEHPYLRGRTLAMIFQKPSLRTRLTFETGMAQLGGHAIYLAPQDIGIGERESVKDVARNLSRWVDLVMIRTFAHEICVELALEASVPVINGLTDLLHPCQLLADLLTLKERFGAFDKLRVAFVGDGFNVCQSWIEAAALARFELRVGCPAGYEPQQEFVELMHRGRLGLLTHDPIEAVRGADVIYTDTWTSMGHEKEAAQRQRDFKAFQVNRDLLSHARRGAVVMHCLPAHRGEEITDEVLDGTRSLVLDQAENRLHAQKAVMVWLLRPSILQIPSAPSAT